MSDEQQTSPLPELPPGGDWAFQARAYGFVAVDRSGRNPDMLIRQGVAEVLRIGINAPPYRAVRNLAGT
jgi:hypothetical protein